VERLVTTLTQGTGKETANNNALDGSLVQWKSRSLCLLCRLSFSLLHSTRKCIHTAVLHCGGVWVRTWMCISLVVYSNPSSLVFVRVVIHYTVYHNTKCGKNLLAPMSLLMNELHYCMKMKVIKLLSSKVITIC